MIHRIAYLAIISGTCIRNMSQAIIHLAEKLLTTETAVSGEKKLEQELAPTINYGSLPKAFDMYILPISVLQLMVPMQTYPDYCQ